MCNNNGACRKMAGGVMCPSYRVTRDEKDVTRGRANTLRLAISGRLGPDALASDEMMETLKLCVSCKGCRRECPTGVDMAKMKIEALAARVKTKGLTLHQRLGSPICRVMPALACQGAWLMNLRDRLPGAATLSERDRAVQRAALVAALAPPRPSARAATRVGPGRRARGGAVRRHVQSLVRAGERRTRR